MIKIVFFDIDDTLLSHKTNSIPESALSALYELKKNGVLIGIATGRSMVEVRNLNIPRDLPADVWVTLNGQYCFDKSGVLLSNPIDKEDIEYTLSHLEHSPFPCIFIEKDRMYINYSNSHVLEIQHAIHSSTTPTGDLRDGLTNDIYQMIVFIKGDASGFSSGLRHCKCTGWANGAIDVISCTGGKDAGIEAVLDKYGIAKTEAMAFGDGINDIDMFKSVGISVAMLNGCPEARAAAQYVTGSVDDGGVLSGLRHFGLL